jgi:deoxycytidylate deaminase
MSFRMASKEAIKSPHPQHKVGAIIVKSGRVLSTGFNSFRYTRELQKNNVHAEEAAILKLLKHRRLSDLSGAEIFVTRFTKGGRVGIARPCASCMSIIKSVGISDVHYTTDDKDTKTMKVI